MTFKFSNRCYRLLEHFIRLWIVLCNWLVRIIMGLINGNWRVRPNCIPELETVGRPSTKTARSMLFQNISAVRQSLGSTAFALLPWLAYADRRLSPPVESGEERRVAGDARWNQSLIPSCERPMEVHDDRPRRNTNTSPILWWDGTPLDGM